MRHGSLKLPRLAILLATLALLAHIAVGVVYWIYSLPRDGALPFAEGFESGDLQQWGSLGRKQLCCDHSAVVVMDPVRSGHHALKVTLDRDDPMMRGNMRAEMRLDGSRMGHEYRYAFSILLPADWVDDPLPVNLVQWHSVPDKLLLESGPSQPLRLVVIGDQWLIDNFWDSGRVTKLPWSAERPEGNRLLWTAPLEKGRWTDWEFRVRWSYGGDGLIEVRKDGRTIVRTQSPNTYNDFVAPYMKLGVYVPAWSDPARSSPVRTRTAYFDDIRVTHSAPVAGIESPTQAAPR